jgi:NADPH-dependent curcumin reductase CurA
MTQYSKRVVLLERPTDAPSLANFGIEDFGLDAPRANEVQVRNLWMSVDPYMRRRLYSEPGYTSSFSVGQPLDGAAVGVVTASNDARFPVGTTVSSFFGWREGFNCSGGQLQTLQGDGLPPEVYLAEAGTTGLAAYVGLLKIAAIQSRETLFVSAAAGAVGLATCQIALAQGCTVIGSAGGTAKCEYLKSIGVHHTIDYHATPDLTAALRAAAVDGIDVYFDNVGGDHLQAALDAAKPFARFVLCGMISQGSGRVTPSSPPPSNLLLAITKRLRLQGFIVGDHAGDTEAFLTAMAGWIATGKVKATSTIRVGLEAAPAALLDLFRGANLGKMLVRLA